MEKIVTWSTEEKKFGNRWIIRLFLFGLLIVRLFDYFYFHYTNHSVIRFISITNRSKSFDYSRGQSWVSFGRTIVIVFQYRLQLSIRRGWWPALGSCRVAAKHLKRVPRAQLARSSLIMYAVTNAWTFPGEEEEEESFVWQKQNGLWQGARINRNWLIIRNDLAVRRLAVLPAKNKCIYLLTPPGRISRVRHESPIVL